MVDQTKVETSKAKANELEKKVNYIQINSHWKIINAHTHKINNSMSTYLHINPEVIAII